MAEIDEADGEGVKVEMDVVAESMSCSTVAKRS